MYEGSVELRLVWEAVKKDQQDRELWKTMQRAGYSHSLHHNFHGIMEDGNYPSIGSIPMIMRCLHKYFEIRLNALNNAINDIGSEKAKVTTLFQEVTNKELAEHRAEKDRLLNLHEADKVSYRNLLAHTMTVLGDKRLEQIDPGLERGLNF